MNLRFNIPSLLTISLLILLFEVSAAPPVGHPSTDDAMNMMKVPEVESFPYQGKVLQAIDSNSYTYIQVELNKLNQKQVWLAAPRVSLTEGQQIIFPEGTFMRNFYSRLLKRTFASIIFVRKVELLPERI